MMTDMIQFFFWFVGVLTIIAGVVGVGNIMLIVVKERTKEIGIRKALGATPYSIITMILHEAIFITLISGFTGLIFGLLLWAGIGPFIESDFFTHPEVDFNIALATVYRDWETDRKSTRLNSSHITRSRMPSSA